MTTDIEDIFPPLNAIRQDVLDDMTFVGGNDNVLCLDRTHPNCIFYRTSNWDKRRPLKDPRRNGIVFDVDWEGKVRPYVYYLLWGEHEEIVDKNSFSRISQKLSKKYSIKPSMANLNYGYKRLIRERLLQDQKDGIPPTDYSNLLIEEYIQGKQIRTTSGVIVPTVLTSGLRGFKGGKAGCQWDCYYCPAEPGMPRSYLKREPAVARADANDFDAVMQMFDRFTVLSLLGGYPDKLDIIVEGGTIASYEEEYLIEFIRDLYYAANVFYYPEGNRRTERYSLEKEQEINQYSLEALKIIGLTLETRPDCINEKQILLFRRLGCTRVQLGIQHINDKILELINRKCYFKDIINAIKMLKDCGFKIDIHIMPDLPGSDPEEDKAMLQQFLDDHRLQVDDWKIYPCQTVDYSELLNWFNNTMDNFKNYLSGEGIQFDDPELTNDVLEEYYLDFIENTPKPEGYHYYIPYTHDFKKTKNLDESNLRKLIDVCKHVKRQMWPWIRINRLVRDIPPEHYVRAGLERADLRQVIQKELNADETPCRCIRCREIGKKKKSDKIFQVIRVYEASDGIEYFISIEDKNEMIYGFTRLRLCHNPGYGLDSLSELKNAAFIRELHIYGPVTPVWMKKALYVQHKGLGSQLINRAEQIAMSHGYTKMSIIAGVGVREYYSNKLGYTLQGTHMVKELPYSHKKSLSYEHLSEWKEGHWTIVKKLRHPIYLKPNDIDPTILMHPYDLVMHRWNDMDAIMRFLIVMVLAFVVKKIIDYNF